MTPIDRFKKTNTEGNLWIYILSLGRGQEVVSDQAPGLIFEKFGFLPNGLTCGAVLFRLKRSGYISSERFSGKKAYKTTQKGLDELQKMKEFCQLLIEKI